jgi:hypothetical protein
MFIILVLPTFMILWKLKLFILKLFIFNVKYII